MKGKKSENGETRKVTREIVRNRTRCYSTRKYSNETACSSKQYAQFFVQNSKRTFARARVCVCVCVCTCWHAIEWKSGKRGSRCAIGDETVNVAAFSREWAREFVECRRISMVGPVASWKPFAMGMEETLRSIEKRIDVDATKEFARKDSVWCLTPSLLAGSSIAWHICINWRAKFLEYESCDIN